MFDSFQSTGIYSRCCSGNVTLPLLLTPPSPKKKKSTIAMLNSLCSRPRCKFVTFFLPVNYMYIIPALLLIVC